MGRLSSLLIGVISGASAAYYLSTEQGKKVTKKVVRFVKDYQEDPQEVHESVKQTAKDVSKQAAEVIQQTKEKLVLEKLRQELFWSLSKKRRKMWLKISRSLSPFKDKLQKENLSGNDLVQSIRKQTESEDIVLELDEKILKKQLKKIQKAKKRVGQKSAIR